MLQDIISNRHQCILFSVHRTILAEQSQTVYIRVNDKSDIMLALLHQSLDVSQVLLQRFRIVLEITCCLHIKTSHGLNTQLFQQFGKNDATDRVHTVKRNLEVCLFNRLNVYQCQILNQIYVLLIIRIVFTIRTQMIYIGIFEIFSFSNTQHFVSFFLIQELTFFVQKLQCVPLARIMRCSQDNTTASTFHRHSNFCCRGRSQTDVYYIEAHTHQRSTNHIFHHFAGNTGVTANHNLVALHLGRLADQSCIRRCKLNNIQRVQRIPRFSSDSTTDTGN